MKKIISILLIFIVCFSSLSVFAYESSGFPDYQPKVNIGRGKNMGKYGFVCLLFLNEYQNIYFQNTEKCLG